MRRPWILPTLLATAQLAAWPGVPLVRGAGPAVVTVVAAVTLVASAAAVLAWRRTRPVAVLLALTGAAALAERLTPGGELVGVAVVQVVAFYQVALRRSGRTAIVVGTVAVAAEVAAALFQPGPARMIPVEAVATAALLAIVAYYGRRRQHWLAGRADAARRLAEAEERSRRAADDERHRLARELHDVAAHHLTAIVVTTSAAQRLTDRRPDLAAEALRFAARTGRDTRRALDRLVAVMGTTDAPGPVDLASLIAGFRDLGQSIEVDVDATPLPPAVAEAAHGIAREALTNTLRYAPGAAVRLRLARIPGAVELTVDDDGAARAIAATGLGSGHGIPGLRARAAAVGGSVTAGPADETAPVSDPGTGGGPDTGTGTGGGPNTGRGTGWRVRAVLPVGPPGEVAAPVPGRRWGPTVGRAVDYALIAAVTVPALAEASALVLLVLATAHAVPVLFRRRYPWWTLAAVLVTDLGWAGFVVGGFLTSAAGPLYAIGTVADIVVVYAVAAYGKVPRLSGAGAVTWLGALATAAGVGLVIGGFMLASARETQTPGQPVVVWIVGSAVSAAALTGPATLVWLTGFLPRFRRARTERRERDAIAASVAQADAAARDERHRIAVGLGDAVLTRTDAVTAAADAGHLDVVPERARAALTAMRELLAGLNTGTAAGTPPVPRDPQPTAAGIPALCGRHAVPLQVSGTARPLPPDVDLSAYRVVELALAAGARDVRLEYTGSGLAVVVRAVPATAAADAPLVGMRVRAGALGGTVTAGPRGTIVVRLPTPPLVPPAAPAPDQLTPEVSPSQSG
jgi:signal transduction histidine kinase